MKTILVPCDLSQSAIEALKFAITLAQKEKAEVHLLHSIELPALHDSSLTVAFEQEYMKDKRTAALEKLNKVVDHWVKGTTEVKVDVAFGAVVPVIENAIASGGFDLVIMGTHGASGIKEYTIGSNTEKIVRNSNVPVIAIRKASTEISDIIFPVNPDKAQETLTTQIKSLQSTFSAKLHLLFVNTPAYFQNDSLMQPKLENFAKRHLLENYTVNIFNDIAEAEGIINFTRQFPSPMVAMRTHGRLGITHLAFGSVTEDVVNHIDCPIWTLRIK